VVVHVMYAYKAQIMIIAKTISNLLACNIYIFGCFVIDSLSVKANSTLLHHSMNLCRIYNNIIIIIILI